VGVVEGRRRGRAQPRVEIRGKLPPAFAQLLAPLTALLAWLPRRVARGSTLIVLTGRSPLSNAAVTRRLEQSGFAVHFLVLPEAHEFLAETRAAGLSARPVRVEREKGSPRAVVVAAA